MIVCSLFLAGLLAVSQDPGLPALEQVSGASDAAGSAISKDCGAYCLAIAASLASSVDVPFDRAKLAVDADEDGLCSIADLTRGFRSLGLEATAREAEPTALPPGLSILHVKASATSPKADHFVVAQELADGRFRFFAPPLGTLVGDGDEMTSLWSGAFVRVGLVEGSGLFSLWWLLGAGVFAGVAMRCLLQRRVRRGGSA